MPSKLIIIRGNSGSGKTTVAEGVRHRLSNGLSDNTMLVQQDTFRREILRERDMPQKRSTIELIELVVEFGRKQGRTIIMEGIFSVKKYGPMLRSIASKFDVLHVYYFDLPFEETLARHNTKPNVHEYGEKEMRVWWNEKDYLGMPNEHIIDKSVDAEAIIQLIVRDIKLPSSTTKGGQE